MINAEGLTKSFGAVVFRDISFSLCPGEALGVTGGNGSGKTTLLNIIAGIERQDGGNLHKNCSLGYVTQKPGFFSRLSCLDNMKYVCALNSMPSADAKKRIAECSEICGLTDFLKKRAGICSGGMLQRLNIALALLPEPDLLLLDEAEAGLDNQSREELRRILRAFICNGKKAIIAVSHYKEEIRGICGRALNIETGKIENV